MRVDAVITDLIKKEFHKFKLNFKNYTNLKKTILKITINYTLQEKVFLHLLKLINK